MIHCIFRVQNSVQLYLQGLNLVSIEPIKSDLEGIGLILKQHRLSVPPYQRPYTWESEQINDLYDDVIKAKDVSKTDQYFLGTVVLSRGDHDTQRVIDGQQRIVSISILISAIRNYFTSKGDEDRAGDITRDYLSKKDLRTQHHNPRILIVPADRDFFQKYVIEVQTIKNTTPRGLSQTQKRLYNCIKLARNFVQRIVEQSSNPSDDLLDILYFLEDKAVLVRLDVHSEANAYVIFEVLNDRGLDLTVADLLKNYVFSRASENGNREKLEECQQLWLSMVATITTELEENDLKHFIRHEWISRNGLVREKNLFDDIKSVVKDEKSALEYVRNLADKAKIYTALRNHESVQWQSYSYDVRAALYFFNIAKMSQIRPILLSIFSKFTVGEVNKVIPVLASWSVRFLVCQTVGSGELEDNYAQRAKDVFAEKIKTTKDLRRQFNIVPPDVEFENHFKNYTVPKAPLARWYLSRIENHLNPNKTNPLTPDTSVVNLEHILPLTPDSSWGKVSDKMMKHVNRIGNLTLIESEINGRLASKNFDQKKTELCKSNIKITKELLNINKWTDSAIFDRQAKLARIAVEVWKI